VKTPLQINSSGKLVNTPHRGIFGNRVVVPEFEIFANPVIRISEVKRRRFNIIDRAIRNLKFRITCQGKLVDKGTL